MTMLPEKIEVACPKCGETFDDWYQPSQDPATAAACPHCHFELSSDRSVRQDCPWSAAVEEVEAEAR